MTNIIAPLPKDEDTVKNLDESHSYLFQDEDFLTCMEVYNAIPDKDRNA